MTAAPEEVQGGTHTLQSIAARELSFYTVDSSAIEDNARNLLIHYSGLAPEEVGPHVDAIVSPLTFLPQAWHLFVTAEESIRNLCISMYWNVSVPRLEHRPYGGVF
jgi:hypothetical protein